MILLSIACSESEAEETQTANSKAVPVEVQVLNDSQYTEYIQVIGTVKPSQKANLSSLEGGQIAQFLRDKGSFVRKGDTLVIIDNDILKANLNAALARYELAKVTFEKQESIFKQNVNSEIQLLQAKSERDQSKANYELMKARYDDTFIIAPFSGIIEFKYIEEGEFAGPGITIISLVDISKVKIEAGIPERYVGSIKIGQKVEVKISEVGYINYSGKISYVGPSIIANNRTFPVEIIIENKNRILKPEMNAILSIEREKYESIITIPDDVVVRSDYGYTVYIEENGMAKKVNIEIIDRFENKIAVKSGLEKGQKLIVVGYQNLVDGQRVNIVN
jgi:RND family efflux transporter MFP subunit